MAHWLCDGAGNGPQEARGQAMVGTQRRPVTSGQDPTCCRTHQASPCSQHKRSGWALLRTLECE